VRNKASSSVRWRKKEDLVLLLDLHIWQAAPYKAKEETEPVMAAKATRK